MYKVDNSTFYVPYPGEEIHTKKQTKAQCSGISVYEVAANNPGRLIADKKFSPASSRNNIEKDHIKVKVLDPSILRLNFNLIEIDDAQKNANNHLDFQVKKNIDEVFSSPKKQHKTEHSTNKQQKANLPINKRFSWLL